MAGSSLLPIRHPPVLPSLPLPRDTLHLRMRVTECDDDPEYGSLTDQDLLMGDDTNSAFGSTAEATGFESNREPDTSLADDRIIDGADTQGDSLPDGDDEYIPNDEGDEMDPEGEGSEGDGTRSELPSVGWSDDMLQTDEMGFGRVSCQRQSPGCTLPRMPAGGQAETPIRSNPSTPVPGPPSTLATTSRKHTTCFRIPSPPPQAR